MFPLCHRAKRRTFQANYRRGPNQLRRRTPLARHLKGLDPGFRDVKVSPTYTYIVWPYTNYNNKLNVRRTPVQSRIPVGRFGHETAGIARAFWKSQGSSLVSDVSDGRKTKSRQLGQPRTRPKWRPNWLKNVDNRSVQFSQLNVYRRCFVIIIIIFFSWFVTAFKFNFKTFTLQRVTVQNNDPPKATWTTSPEIYYIFYFSYINRHVMSTRRIQNFL